MRIMNLLIKGQKVKNKKILEMILRKYNLFQLKNTDYFAMLKTAKKCINNNTWKKTKKKNKSRTRARLLSLSLYGRFLGSNPPR